MFRVPVRYLTRGKTKFGFWPNLTHFVTEIVNFSNLIFDCYFEIKIIRLIGFAITEKGLKFAHL